MTVAPGLTTLGAIGELVTMSTIGRFWPLPSCWAIRFGPKTVILTSDFCLLASVF